MPQRFPPVQRILRLLKRVFLSRFIHPRKNRMQHGQQQAENRNVLRSFLVAQTFNIVVTFVIACLLFGLLKPAL